MLTNEESRIQKDPATSPTATVDTDYHTERCRRCRRRIWSKRSLSRHAGPKCWRRERVAA